MKYLFLVIILLPFHQLFGQKSELITKFESSGKKETVTYDEGISFYQKIADQYPEITIKTMGLTDSGKPLHMVVYSSDREFDFVKIKAANRPVFLINNAIHAGEPDGVDASMLLLRNMAVGKILKKQRKDLVLVIIPFYNIGGVLNRNSNTRVNQKGPIAYGFRGNARNFDLNRDFIKGDTRNAHAFWEIFQMTDPDFFLDTHVSNGADYQYAITLISSQKEKLSEPLRATMGDVITPALFRHMDEADEPMTPFVNVYGKTPDNGFSEFADWPRYSTGYAALFNTYGFMSETHMLKPFDRRVEATYQLMLAMSKTLVTNKEDILSTRSEAKERVKSQTLFPVKWKLDEAFVSELDFKGYEGSYIESDLTDQKRLYYDREKPFERKINYKNRYQPEVIVTKPSSYVIPQGWFHVVERLEKNGVQIAKLSSDMTIKVKVYFIKDYKTIQSQYEGHYFHYDLQLEEKEEMLEFRKGDFVVACNQLSNRFIVETLEPLAEDSYFKWNMFDTVLGSKEGFSAYVFEELAMEVLANNPSLMKQYMEKQKTDKEFAGNRYRQLAWIYQNSKYKEKEHLRYPIFKVE